MKYYILALTTVLLHSFSASATNSTTTCRGSTFTDDGFSYENITLTARFDDDRGKLDLYADGQNDKFEYDIANRFPNLEFIGSTKKNSLGRVVLAKMSGNYLPDQRGISTSIDMSRPQTVTKVTIERTDGVLIKALLSCETTLAPICHEETKCGNSCYPMIGCEPVCRTRTVCEPQKFE